MWHRTIPMQLSGDSIAGVVLPNHRIMPHTMQIAKNGCDTHGTIAQKQTYSIMYLFHS